uniref:Uncharacterized protein n=1 Tax=uncultured prokaryote TaxID=198431 RepID=A0A0H5Q713_9ZZZZ|nr:hypothetical protein [uncultured prokaryote]
MPLEVPPGYAIASIKLTAGFGTPAFVTTMGITLNDVFSELTDFADYVHGTYSGIFQSITSNDLVMEGVSLFLTGENGNGSIDSTNLTVPGTNTAESAMIAMSPVVQKRTGRFGRSGRGRMYLPGVLKTADVDSGGRIDPAKVTQIQERADDWLDALRGVGGPGLDSDVGPVLLHSSPSVMPTPITKLTCQPIVGLTRGRIR